MQYSIISMAWCIPAMASSSAAKKTPLPSVDETSSDAGQVAAKGEAEQDGGYLRKDQLEAVTILISGVTVAQARSPYSLKDASDLWAEIKDKPDSVVNRGIRAAQQKACPYTLEDATLLFNAIQLLVAKPDEPEADKTSN